MTSQPMEEAEGDGSNKIQGQGEAAKKNLWNGMYKMRCQGEVQISQELQ